MNLIKQCFQEHEGAFIEQLKDAGFSTDQAMQFLPEAASGLLGSTQHQGVEEMTRQLASDGPDQILSSVNVNAVAEKLGMNSDLVTKGFAAIAPLLAQAFLQKSDGLVETVTSLAPGLFKRFS